ncbi:cytochrome P450 [Syncephalis fuscata]|nr:cytochrome P450 [Syncephalis fuscata]
MEPVKVYEMHERYGPIVRIGKDTIWISDAAMIRKVNGSYQYTKGHEYDHFSFKHDTLFSTRNNEYHRVLKRLMMPAYATNTLNDLEPLIYKVGIARLVVRLQEYADSGSSVDLMDMLKKMTFDIIGEVAFGKTFGLLEKQESHPIIKWMQSRIQYGTLKFLLGRLFFLNMYPKLVQDINAMDKYAIDIIKKRRKALVAERHDILQRLLDAVDEETGATLSDEYITAEIASLMIAGTDTTALTLTWTMHYLLQHPECFNRLANEIRSVYPNPDTPMVYKDVLAMTYLDAVLHESMRIQPIAIHGMPRIIPDGGTHLGDYFIPGGTTVMVSVGAMQMNKDVFPEPELFRPDRWIDSSPEQLAKMKFNFTPFSVGPRACIGRSLAWMELRLTLAGLARHFTFVSSPENDMRPFYQGPASPKGGVFVVQVSRA